VANTFDTSAVPPAADGDTDKKSVAEISCEPSGETKSLPESAPTSKKPAAVQEKPPKKALPAKPWLKKKASVAAQHAPVVEKGEAAGGEESQMEPVAKGGYNMDFLDQLEDPNFNPFQTKSRVVTEEEAVLTSSSSADLPSSSSADPPSSSSAHLPSSLSADIPSSSSAGLPSSSSAGLPSSSSADLPSSASADLPSNSSADVYQSSSCAASIHPPTSSLSAADPADTASGDLLSSATAVPVSPAAVPSPSSSAAAADSPSSAAAVPPSLSVNSLTQAPAAAVLDSLLAADIEEPHRPARLNPGNQKLGKFTFYFLDLPFASNQTKFFLSLRVKIVTVPGILFKMVKVLHLSQHLLFILTG
jgi:hypothetical protein